MAQVSLATRHVMQANKATNTKPELVVRAALREAGLPGYRLHWKKVPGRPDICYPGRKVAIFVHGCFWHRCPRCALPSPKSNVAFWDAKFERNRTRDQRVCEMLIRLGWTVVIVWECQLKGDRLAHTMRQVAREVRHASDRADGEGRLVEAGGLPVWQLRRGCLNLRTHACKRTR